MKGQEERTQLRGKDVCRKDDPKIILRGEIDSLYSRAVLTCVYAKQYGAEQVISGLEDIVRAVRELMRGEALGQEPDISYINGMDFDELRHVSHNVESELGLVPYFPDEFTDDVTAYINLLRTDIRRTERAAVAAGEDRVTRAIQLVLNRLSSAAYILMLENRAERYGE